MAWSPASLFRHTPQVKVVNPQDLSQGQQAPAGGGTGAPTGQPGSSMQQRTPQPGMQQQTAPAGAGNAGTDSPLDQFQGLWKTPESKPGQPPADPFSEALFQTDPTKLREAASQMDFTRDLNPELLQKALSGDVQALIGIINHVGQQSLATSLQLGTATVEHAGRTIGDRFKKALPGQVRDLQINTAVPNNPILAHPAVQPMLVMLRRQAQMANPDATAEQINAMAEDYITKLATTLNPASPGSGSSTDNFSTEIGQQDNFDWMSWSGMTPPSQS